jgi:hypothetical protein
VYEKSKKQVAFHRNGCEGVKNTPPLYVKKTELTGIASKKPTLSRPKIANVDDNVYDQGNERVRDPPVSHLAPETIREKKVPTEASTRIIIRPAFYHLSTTQCSCSDTFFLGPFIFVAFLSLSPF